MLEDTALNDPDPQVLQRISDVRGELLLATLVGVLVGAGMFAFGLLVLVLLFRPQGILGKKLR